MVCTEYPGRESVRCNMCDRYVPISSSAQWERAIGRESNEERSAVCGTYVQLRRDHSSRCCWHLARGTWRSRSGEWSTHEEAIERLAGSRARESVCRCAPAVVVVFAAHFTRSLLLRRSMRACHLPLAGRRVVRTRPGRRTRRQASGSSAGIGWIFRFRRIGRDFRSCAIFSVLSVSTDSGAHRRSYPTLARHWLADAMQRNIGVRAGIFLGELRVAGWLCCCFVLALSLLHLIASHVPFPSSSSSYHHVEGDRSPRARRCGSRPVGPMPSWPVLVERHDSLLPVLPGLVLVGVRLDLVRSLRCWYVNGGGAAGGGGGVRSASWVAVGGCVPARTGARRESNA